MDDKSNSIKTEKNDRHVCDKDLDQVLFEVALGMVGWSSSWSGTDRGSSGKTSEATGEITA